MARNLPIYYRTVSAFEVETPIRLDGCMDGSTDVSVHTGLLPTASHSLKRT